MAHAPEIRLPIKADPTPVIAVIDVIVKHLTALRSELAATGNERKGVRYWTDLPADLEWGDFPMRALRECGLRLIEEGPRTGRSSQMYLIDDPGAPQDLAGRTVSLVFEQTDDGPVRVAQRDVIA